MARHTLSLESLRDLEGGKTAAIFDTHLKRASNDCYDRPGDETVRKVVLEVHMTPVLDPSSSMCDEVSVQIYAHSAVPKHRTKAISMGIQRNGQLVFNEDSPDDINQSTLLPDE